MCTSTSIFLVHGSGTCGGLGVDTCVLRAYLPVAGIGMEGREEEGFSSPSYSAVLREGYYGFVPPSVEYEAILGSSPQQRIIIITGKYIRLTY